MAEHHRETDSIIVGHAKAADGALAFLKNWIGVAVVLIGLGMGVERIVGKIEAAETASNVRFTAVEKSVDDFKKEVRENLKNTGTEASAANRGTLAILHSDEANQNAYNANVIKVLTEIVTTMKDRGMRAPVVPDPPKLGGQ
jgi:hypothetical protein